MRTARAWNDILIQCQVKPTVAAKWSEIFAEVIHEDSFSKGEEELDDFLGQVLHESGGLQQLEENLNYSVAAMMRVWPGRFPTEAAAEPYANNPVKLANKVYGGRYGNDQPGDGWAYRGRSLIQTTFKDNYTWLGDLMGQDLGSNPDLLAQPHYALEAAILWWEGKVPDEMLGDPERITKRVNGGLIGLAHRVHLTDLAGKALS